MRRLFLVIVGLFALFILIGAYANTRGNPELPRIIDAPAPQDPPKSRIQLP